MKITAPSIEIYEYFRAVAPAIGPTRLITNIVGPLYILKKNSLVGEYDGDNDLAMNLNLESPQNAVFDSSYTKFYIKSLVPAMTYSLPYLMRNFQDLNIQTRINATGNLEIVTSLELPIRINDWIKIHDPIPLKGLMLKINAVLFDGSVYSLTLEGLPSGYENKNIKCSWYIHNPVEQSSGVYLLSKYAPDIPSTNPLSDIATTTTDIGGVYYVTIPVPQSGGKDRNISVGDFVYIISSTNSSVLEAGKTYKAIQLRRAATGELNVVLNKTVPSGTDTTTISFYQILGSSPLRGKVFADRRALDLRYPDMIVVNTVEDLKNQFGEPDLDNPLVMGAYFAMLNGATPLYMQAIKSDDDAGYMEATSIWDKYDFYAVCPLTYSDVVISGYHAKAVEFSDPTVAKWKRVVCGKDIPKRKSFYSGDQTKINSVISYVDDTKFRITFLESIPWNKIVVNKTKFRVISSDPAFLVGEYVVVGFDSNLKTIDCEGNIAKNQTITTISFSLENDATTAEQVEMLASYGETYASKLISVVVGDVYTEIDGVRTKIPTYYAGAGLAGMVEGYAPQIQFNGYPIAGIVKVENTWDRFNEDELSTIAGGGVIILVQDNINSMPYIRNQLTTDVSGLLQRSLSVVKSVDYLKKLLYDNLTTFLKGWNVVDEAIMGIETMILSILRFCSRYRVPKAGSLIIGGNIKEIVASGNEVSVKIDVIFPKPLEKIVIELYVT